MSLVQEVSLPCSIELSRSLYWALPCKYSFHSCIWCSPWVSCLTSSQLVSALCPVNSCIWTVPCEQPWKQLCPVNSCSTPFTSLFPCSAHATNVSSTTRRSFFCSGLQDFAELLVSFPFLIYKNSLNFSTVGHPWDTCYLSLFCKSLFCLQWIRENIQILSKAKDMINSKVKKGNQCQSFFPCSPLKGCSYL